MIRWLGVVILCCGAAAAGCERTSGADLQRQQRLVITGSSTLAPLVAEIAKRFERENPGVRIDVQAGGSSRGIVDARSGSSDIGMISRALDGSEQDLIVHPVALDGICLVVHADNPLRQLSRAEVIDIYTGRITQWQDLGGLDESIVVVNKADGRATLGVFLDHFGLKSSDIKASIVIGDTEQGIKTIAGQPAAIGYCSMGAAQYYMESGAPLRLLPTGGVDPSLDNVRTGRFPLSRPLQLITREQPVGLVRRFIEYSRSDAVHDLVATQYFIPAGP